MDIKLSRECNKLNLLLVAKYLQQDPETILGFYEELLEDSHFISQLNEQMEKARTEISFTKGIFGKGKIDSVDWFAFQRILLYVLMRTLKPAEVLETGVYYGGNTVFLLKGLADNSFGKLTSIDLPDSKIRGSNDSSRHPDVGDSELYNEQWKPGFLIPETLRKRWNLIEGSSLDEIPKLKEVFDFYIHDSDHSFKFMRTELELAHEKLSPRAVMLADDLDWSNAFYAFSVSKKYAPLLLTDNGKNGLLVRTGMLWRDHPNNRDIAFVGE